MIMQLDIESLRTLVMVLDQGGMTAAAKRLNLTQSAVSWKIKRLEDRVGRPLLIRDGHSIRPSRDGRALIDDARTLIEIHDGAVARLTTSELTGTVKVGSNEEVDATRMAAVLGRFKRIHSRATLEVLVESTEHLSELLDAGNIDVAVIQVYEDQLRADDRVLWSDELRWAISRDTPFDVGVVPLVTFGEHCFYRPLSEPLLEAAGIDYTVSFSLATAAGVRGAVAAGLGVGVLGSRYLSDNVVEWQRGAAVAPLPAVYQIARAVPGEQPAIATALLEAIVEELRGPTAARGTNRP